jgi:alpha-beta hydrolase superfamily lysophospholipase
VLYIHGYVDYFFQNHLADFFETVTAPRAPMGCDFFALDLRKYGRSLPRDYKYPNFAKSLDEYFEEITFALGVIKSEGYTFILLNGHSTGALTAVRYVQSGDLGGNVSALFLNSPFLDFSDRDLDGSVKRFLARLAGRLKPKGVRSTPSVPIWYARSLLLPSECADCHGRWTFNQEYKPIKGFPVFFGWVRAIINAQDRALKEKITKPILILHSARSNDGTDTIWHEEYRRADLVLDVEDMKNLGPTIGPNVAIREVEGGVHDLMLSDPDARARVYNEVTAWMRTLR